MTGRLSILYIPCSKKFSDQNRALKAEWPEEAKDVFFAERRWLAYGWAKGTKMVRSFLNQEDQFAVRAVAK